MPSAFRTPLVTPCLRTLARIGLRLSGWRVDMVPPVAPPYVCIGAPHTSNLDFLLMLAALLELGVDARWLGKDSLFRNPVLGAVLRWLGGIPTDRSKAGNQVARAAALLRAQPDLVLCVAPEGTRSKVARWKSGFYYIAREAQVPIMLGLLDAPAKRLRLLGLHQPGADVDAGIAGIREQYRGHGGLVPANASDWLE